MGRLSGAMRQQWKRTRDAVHGSAALLEALVRVHGHPPADVPDEGAEAGHAR